MCSERSHEESVANLVLKVIQVHDPGPQRGEGIIEKGLNGSVNPVKNTTRQVDLEAIIHLVVLLLQNAGSNVAAILTVGLQLQNVAQNALSIRVADPQHLDVTLNGVGTHVVVQSAQNAAQKNEVVLLGQNIVQKEAVSLHLQNIV